LIEVESLLKLSYIVAHLVMIAHGQVYRRVVVVVLKEPLIHRIGLEL
jgi:hypothetical protein